MDLVFSSGFSSLAHGAKKRSLSECKKEGSGVNTSRKQFSFGCSVGTYFFLDPIGILNWQIFASKTYRQSAISTDTYFLFRRPIFLRRKGCGRYFFFVVFKRKNWAVSFSRSEVSFFPFSQRSIVFFLFTEFSQFLFLFLAFTAKYRFFVFTDKTSFFFIFYLLYRWSQKSDSFCPKPKISALLSLRHGSHQTYNHRFTPWNGGFFPHYQLEFFFEGKDSIFLSRLSLFNFTTPEKFGHPQDKNKCLRKLTRKKGHSDRTTVTTALRGANRFSFLFFDLPFLLPPLQSKNIV